MQYNLLFLFVGLGIDDPIWVPTVLTKNRDQLLTTEPDAGMPPDEDGASGDPPVTRPADAPSSPTRDQPDDRPAQRNHNAEGDSRGEKRSNGTHASTTDPGARAVNFPAIMADHRFEDCRRAE